LSHLGFPLEPPNVASLSVKKSSDDLRDKIINFAQLENALLDQSNTNAIFNQCLLDMFRDTSPAVFSPCPSSNYNNTTNNHRGPEGQPPSPSDETVDPGFEA
jgi:hypothetical protein